MLKTPLQAARKQQAAALVPSQAVRTTHGSGVDEAALAHPGLDVQVLLPA